MSSSSRLDAPLTRVRPAMNSLQVVGQVSSCLLILSCHLPSPPLLPPPKVPNPISYKACQRRTHHVSGGDHAVHYSDLARVSMRVEDEVVEVFFLIYILGWSTILRPIYLKVMWKAGGLRQLPG